MSEKQMTKFNDIQSRIFEVRGLQVMLDYVLAELYGVEVKRLNEQVKRNINRFPKRFRFQLTKQELENLKSQFATSSKDSQHGGKRKLSYAFTEQGVSMLSAVLKSETAINVSIQIMDAFVNMRKFLTNNASIFQRLDKVEQKQLITDTKLDKVLNAIELKEITPKQGIFYNGQIFDAYKLVADIIRTAKKSIIVIDNYIDDMTLQLFTKRKSTVNVVLYTKNISKTLKQDLEKYNAQYSKIEVLKLQTSHDRFMIIDSKNVYHFGASLKDLGKKWFAFSKLEMNPKDIIEKLESNA
ncbi:MAG: ORF6N domain-containing protein [Thermodesulfobacteriota bacterium]|nr:ORF6N domain-containing protein [Thermodesulfobacteriota bacterium]